MAKLLTIIAFPQNSSSLIPKDNFLKAIPESTGIYRLYDSEDSLMYVGKAKNLKNRLQQYQNASRKKIHRKMRFLFKNMQKIEIESCATEKEALLKENRIIQEKRPPYNVTGAYYFLYPYMGFKTHPDNDTWLTLIYSTNPEELPEENIHLFGCYRSRFNCKESYQNLCFLLGIIGHLDRKLSKKQIEASFSHSSTFRRLGIKWQPYLRSYLRGESMDLLSVLAKTLLEKPQARSQAKEIQNSLKLLKKFYQQEIQKLRQVLTTNNIDADQIDQSERDQLFIASS